MLMNDLKALFTTPSRWGPDAGSERIGLYLPTPLGLDSLWAYAAYAGATRRQILKMKFNEDAALARAFGRRMAEVLGRPRAFPDVVVPVPLSFRRRVSRGFNQAAQLAHPIAKRLRAPLATWSLARTRETEKQSVSRGIQARRANLEAAFAVRRKEVFQGRTVMLVDDVLTSGATARACAQALRAAGAVRVDVVVLARTR